MDTSAAWVAAIFGLVGALIGALATGGTQLFLDRRTHSRDAARARRLILGELMQAHTMLSVIASQRVFRTSADIAALFPVTAWQQHSAQLEGITDDVRNAMVQVYSELLVMRGSYVWAIVEQAGGILTPEMADQIRKVDADVTTLRTMLTPARHGPLRR
jgi:hypothetical protein